MYYEIDQATLKTRYCGHLYSPLNPKWTLLDHPDGFSLCMGALSDGGVLKWSKDH